MDIHPPEGPTRSFKDFAIHILVVTIGILIALSLEGIRESWREHRAIEEARSSFRDELRTDGEQLRLDLASVHQVNTQLNQLLTDLPQLSKSPVDLEHRVRALEPGFYFFRTTAWESAVASGTLSHMKTEELNRYANAYLSVKNYQDVSRTTLPEWVAVESYFQSHHTYSPAEQATREEQLRTLQMSFKAMEHVGNEMSADINAALSTH